MKSPRKPAPRRKSVAPAQAPRTPTYDDVLAIVRLIESGSRFSDFRLRSGDIEVEIHRANGSVSPGAAAPAGIPGAGAPSVIPGAADAAMARDPIGPGALPEGAHIIRSPMVGTFYRSPQPGAPPFVQNGSRVEPDAIVCIIEVMKLMNSVTAGVAGVVTHVFAEDAHRVEYGEPLIAIGPGR